MEQFTELVRTFDWYEVKGLGLGGQLPPDCGLGSGAGLPLFERDFPDDKIGFRVKCVYETGQVAVTGITSAELESFLQVPAFF